MKKLPMLLQLALILFCVMIIPTLVMLLYSGSQILSYSEKAIADTSLDSLDSNQRLTESALTYVMQNTVRLASTKLFDQIRPLTSYAKLNAEYHRVETALPLLMELQGLVRSNEGVHSAYFYLHGADYIISSDAGITPLTRYENIEWTEQVLAKKTGIAGIWQARVADGGEMLISYVLPLSRLSTSTKGTLVVNFNEAQIAQFMDLSATDDASNTIVNLDNGLIISHHDKELLEKNAREIPVISHIVQDNSEQGFLFEEQHGERFLYTWKRSQQFNWIYISQSSMDKLMAQTGSVQQKMIIFTIIIILAGTVLTVLVATWVSKPVRQLVGAIRIRNNFAESAKNELAFLDSAFRRMQEEEEKLNQLVADHEQDACSLVVHHLLRGDMLKSSQQALVQEMFPHRYYKIAVISIDHYSKYVSKTSPEARSYHRYAFLSSCESSILPYFHAKSVYYGEDKFVMLLNFEHVDKQVHAQIPEQYIDKQLTIVQQQALAWFGHTATIGLSHIIEAEEELPPTLIEAMELIKHRMIEGNGRIIHWREQLQHNKKYIYPLNSERRIINFIDTNNIESIVVELEDIQRQIEATNNISYDNIVFIYNQLVGVTIKHLNEINVNTSAIFINKGNIYSAIAAMDTLDELTAYLKHFYYEIGEYLCIKGNEVNYLELIFDYLDKHYNEDIVFEDMAREIGISYSYMRKLVYEGTGKSLIDYMNHKRIQMAKQLLISTPLNVSKIATEVGYNNIQSFNRFFRKYEGITPSSYKLSKLNGS